MNLYAYTGNDPINLLDPTGMTADGSSLLANPYDSGNDPLMQAMNDPNMIAVPDCKSLSLNNPSAFWNNTFATPEQVDAFFHTTNAPASWDGYNAATTFSADDLNPGLAVGIIGGETSFGNNGLSTRNTNDPFSSGGSDFDSSDSRGANTVIKLENNTYTDNTPVSALFNGQNALPSNIPGSGQVYSTTDGARYPGYIDYWYQQLAKFIGACQ